MASKNEPRRSMGQRVMVQTGLYGTRAGTIMGLELCYGVPRYLVALDENPFDFSLAGFWEKDIVPDTEPAKEEGSP